MATLRGLAKDLPKMEIPQPCPGMAKMVPSLVLMPDLALRPHTQEGLDLFGEVGKIYQ